MLSRPRAGFSPTILLKAPERARAGRIGAERKADEPDSHRHRRAGARAAGYVARIEGIARHAEGRAGADQPGGKLVEVGFADEHRAGSALAICLSSATTLMSSACSATVLVMYLGKIIESGPVEAVFDNPAHPCTKGW